MKTKTYKVTSKINHELKEDQILQKLFSVQPHPNPQPPNPS